MNEIARFLIESLAIEGIFREPTEAESSATAAFLGQAEATASSLHRLQAVYAPGKPMRDRQGMDVRVGNHRPPLGGAAVLPALQAICEAANAGEHPYHTHHRFETLHPYLDGNGRTGRALWAWHMLKQDRDPFALGFLHRWYYQSLEFGR